MEIRNEAFTMLSALRSFVFINKNTHAYFRAHFVKTKTGHENLIGIYMYLFVAKICNRTRTVHYARTPH